MTQKVLVVDDEVELAASTAEYLAAFGFNSICANSIAVAREQLHAHTPDLILLDVNLPDGSGFQLCRELRAEGKYASIPIIFLTARQADDDEILALSIGGDDYVRKPYSLAVLLAKVKRTLARTATPATTDYDDGYLKLSGGRVFVESSEIDLTAMEYRLLDYLVSRLGSVATKAELFENVWQEAITGDGTLSVHVRRLRRRIEPDPDEPTYIRTVWGRGYLFAGRH